MHASVCRRPSKNADIIDTSGPDSVWGEMGKKATCSYCPSSISSTQKTNALWPTCGSIQSLVYNSLPSSIHKIESYQWYSYMVYVLFVHCIQLSWCVIYECPLSNPAASIFGELARSQTLWLWRRTMILCITCIWHPDKGVKKWWWYLMPAKTTNKASLRTLLIVFNCWLSLFSMIYTRVLWWQINSHVFTDTNTVRQWRFQKLSG